MYEWVSWWGWNRLDVGLAQVHCRLAVHHPLGDGLADTAAMGYPHAFRRPEPLDLGRLAEDGHPVRREDEHAVDLLHQLGVLKSGHELARRYHPLAKRGLRPRHHRRHLGGVSVTPDILRLQEQRLVIV